MTQLEQCACGSDRNHKNFTPQVSRDMKCWDKCLNLFGYYIEKYVVCMSLSPFVSFQSQFVTCLLTFPRIYWHYSHNLNYCNKYPSNKKRIHLMVENDTFLSASVGWRGIRNSTSSANSRLLRYSFLASDKSCCLSCLSCITVLSNSISVHSVLRLNTSRCRHEYRHVTSWTSSCEYAITYDSCLPQPISYIRGESHTFSQGSQCNHLFWVPE